MSPHEVVNDVVVSGSLKAGYLPAAILRILKKDRDTEYTATNLQLILKRKLNSVNTALRRLAYRGFIMKRKYGNLNVYCFPGGVAEITQKLIDLTGGLPHKHMHNITLFYQFTKNKHATLGVEKLISRLGCREGSKDWYDRTISWIVGRNSGKKKPPSLQLFLACSKKPMTVEILMKVFEYLEGFLDLEIFEKPENWKLLSIDFNTDYKLGMRERITGSYELYPFVDALCRLYDKKIDGVWIRRSEMAAKWPADYAPTIASFSARVQGGPIAQQAEAMIVASLQHMESNSQATRQSMQQMQRSFNDQQQKTNEQMTVLAQSISQLATEISKLKEDQDQ